MLFKKLFSVILALALVVVLSPACKTRKPVAPPTPVAAPTPVVDCSTTNATYSNNIAPIIANNCMPCHEAGSLLDFTTYEKLSVVAKDGELDRRVLLLKDMPPLGPLSEDDQKKIRCWLDNGALNN